MKRMILAILVVWVCCAVGFSAGTDPTVTAYGSDNITTGMFSDPLRFWHGAEDANGQPTNPQDQYLRYGPWLVKGFASALMGDIDIDIAYYVRDGNGSAAASYGAAVLADSTTSASGLIDLLHNETATGTYEGCTGTLPIYIDIVHIIEDSQDMPLLFVDGLWGDMATSPISNSNDGFTTFDDDFTSAMWRWTSPTTTETVNVLNPQPRWVDGRSTFTLKIIDEWLVPTTACLRIYPYGSIAGHTLDTNADTGTSETVLMIHK